MALVELRNVNKDYDTEGQKVHALRDVTLSFESGEFVTIVGRSGCGKSTLLNLVGAMDFPSRGAVLIAGKNTSDMDDQSLTQLRRDNIEQC